jgi:hypothetical protein
MKNVIAILAVLLVAGPSFAATGAPNASNTNGKTYEMCDGLGVSGVCYNADSVDLYAAIPAYRQFTFFFSETGAGATCDIYAGTQDLANNMPVELDSSYGTKINSISLSSAATAQSFEAPFYILWVECVAGSGDHTVLLQTSK